MSRSSKRRYASKKRSGARTAQPSQQTAVLEQNSTSYAPASRISRDQVYTRNPHEAYERQVLESFLGWNPGYDLLNQFEQFYDGIRLISPFFTIQYNRRRLGGDFILLSDSQYDLLRVYSRWNYRFNPFAQGALKTLLYYTVGRGFEYHVAPRKYRDVSKADLRVLDQFLDDFIEKNYFCQYETEAFVRQHRDGDCFLFIDDSNAALGDDGIPTIKFIEPERIRGDKVYGKDGMDEWSFGIKSPHNDPSKHEAYALYNYPYEEEERITAEYMVEFKNDTDMNIKRGTSDFLSIEDILDDCTRLHKAGRQGEAAREAIAYARQWSQLPAASVQSVVNAETSYQVPSFSPQNPGGQGPSTYNVQKFPPGCVPNIPKGLEYVEGPKGSGENFKLYMEQALKAVTTMYCMPSWLLTGESSNYAEALVKEAPFVKTIEYYQKQHSYRLCQGLLKVLRIAARVGSLPARIERLLDDIKIEAECPPVATRNKKEEFSIDLQLHQLQLISDMTLCERNDLDYEVEQERIKSQPKRPEQLNFNAQEEQQQGDQQQELNYSTTPSAQYSRDVNREGQGVNT